MAFSPTKFTLNVLRVFAKQHAIFVVELGCFRWDKFSRLNICPPLDRCFSTRLRRATKRRTDTWEFFGETEKEEENRDRTNRGERAPECRHIRDILARFAIFSQILYPRDAASANARTKPAFSLIGKIQRSVCSMTRFISLFEDVAFRTEISTLNNLAPLFSSFRFILHNLYTILVFSKDVFSHNRAPGPERNRSKERYIS